MATPDNAFQALAERAVTFIPNQGLIGLGTGKAATAFIHALGKCVQEKRITVTGVPTSKASETLAKQLGIPLTTLEQVESLDVAVDGSDEVDPRGDLIKGLGGALIREKIVAASAKKFVVVVGDEKLVPVLGAHGVLPVEVVPFGLSLCSRRLTALGIAPKLRLASDGKPYVSDNGNYILDAQIKNVDRPADLERQLLDVPGVVGTGFFLGMATTILIQHGGDVEVREPKKA
jgi:ribose 5-phosphate isomerase A